MRSAKQCLAVAVCVFVVALSSVWADSYKGEELFSPADLSFSQKAGFDVIEMDGASYLLVPGSPLVPCKYIDVALSQGATVTGATLLHAAYIELPGRYDVIPSARPRQCSNPVQANPFIKNEAVYGADAVYPAGGVEILREWSAAGQEFVTLRLSPVQYNPATGKVFLATSITYEVAFDIDPGFEAKTLNLSDRVRARTEKRLKSRAVNPHDVAVPAWNGMGSRALPAGDYEYVVITTTSFENEWDVLLDHHTSIGLPSTVVTTDYIYSNYSGSTQYDEIRNFVIDAHATWGTIYFLIGGDSSKVPCGWAYHVGNNIPSDVYYADYDNDWHCEVYVGRAPVDTTGEITTFIGKTFDYMVSPPSGFGEEVFFMGFDLDSSSPSEDLMEIISGNWLPAWADYSREYDSEGGSHENDVDGYINSGKALVNHSDHCNTTVVGVGSYRHGSHLSISECQAFNNGARQSVFYSLGCYCGNFEGTDCWIEEFIKDSDGGGVGAVGNSRYGWYSPSGPWHVVSSLFDRKFFKILWEPEFQCWHSGETNSESKNNIYVSGDYDQYCFMETNLFGDPALPIWTNVPTVPTLSYCPLIGLGQQGFTVNVKSGSDPVEGALVCANIDGDVYERAETNAEGNVILFVDPSASGTMNVTASGDNLLPTHESCTVDASGTDMTIGVSLDNTNYLLGDTIHYDLTVTNNTGTTQNSTVWVNLTLPSGNTYPAAGSLASGPWTLTFAPYETKNGSLPQFLPWYAPTGAFMFNAYVGPEPGIVNEAHEAFSVSP